MRTRVFTTLILTVAVSGFGVGCGAASEPSVNPTVAAETEFSLTGFSPDEAEVMNDIATKLGEDSRLRGAKLSAPPESLIQEGSPAVKDGAKFLTLETPSTDDPVDHARAQWDASIALAAFWKEMNTRSESIWGGRLVEEKNGATVDHSELGDFVYIFEPNAEDFHFKDDTGSTLALDEDQEAVESRIVDNARSLGVQLDGLSFPGGLGTAVVIEVVANDPVGLLKSASATERVFRLFEDGKNLEGVFVDVRDPDGGPVAYWGWSHGLRTTMCGVGDEYQQYYNCGH